MMNVSERWRNHGRSSWSRWLFRLLVTAVGALVIGVPAVATAQPAHTSTGTARLPGAQPTPANRSVKPRPHTHPAASIPGPLLDQGGPVQNAPRLYVDFWGWTSDPSGEQPYLLNFLGSVGGSPWLQTVAQYGGGNASVLAGTWSDPSPPPINPSEQQIQDEAMTAAAHFGLGSSVNDQIIVATPTGILSPGFGTEYCAYHGALAAQPNLTYTNLPYMTDAGYACGANVVDGPLDGVSIVEGHELAEAITDPLLNAWIDAGGNEIADKCAWESLSNIALPGGTFPVQLLWSNQANGCVLSSGSSQGGTSTSLTSSANPSAYGQAVTFTAKVSATSGSGTPSGSVTFTDGPTTICNRVALAATQARCAISSLTLGAHTITATYSGDNTFTSSHSTPSTQTVSLAFIRRPGLATALGIGGTGSAVWIIGANPVGGGNYGIYHWNGTTWAQVPGGAVRIAVDPSGLAWVINSAHSLYHWNGSGWAFYGGGFSDIGIGADGVFWAIGTHAMGGGNYGIYHWNGNRWAQAPGGAVRIAVDPSGLAWVINSAHHLYHWNGSSWTAYPGAATNIAVGANGSVWATGVSLVGSNYGIYHWTGNGWTPVAGGAMTIAVTSTGHPWVINAAHQIYSS